MTIDVNTAIAGAALLAGILSLALIWRERFLQKRDDASLRLEIDRGRQECLGQIERVSENLELTERNAQSHVELLRDGRLGVPARARALRMLRSGAGTDATAKESGMARSEVRLLEKVAAALAPRG